MLGQQFQDMLHMVHQGVGPIAIAAMLTHHFEETGVTLDGLSEVLSHEVWADYKNWVKPRSDVVSASSSRFSGLRLGRDSWQNYAELASCYKGAMIKFMLYWAASYLKKLMEQTNTETSRLRAYCSHALAMFQYLQDSNGPWLSQETAEEMCHYGRTFLIYYQILAKDARTKSPDRRMYKTVPKFHVLLHACLYVQKTKRNPRYDHLYMEEDFMKHVAQICGKCHPKTIDWVSLSRYRCLLELC